MRASSAQCVQAALAERFTLLIPTFNRPGKLANLLQFLARRRFSARVVVCDSSADEHHARNRESIAALGNVLRAEVHRFPATTPVWEKFSRGAELVATPYAAFCADDDIILPDSIAAMIDFLDANPAHVVAHGWYFAFYAGDHVGVTTIVYRDGRFEEDDALRRIRSLAARYEALTYGVHRAGPMRSALAQVQGLGSMLTQEIGSGAFTLVHGKAARLPLLYYGRSLSESEPYDNWHPLETFINRPDRLFTSYYPFRERLVDSLLAHGAAHSRDDLAAFLDLYHLRYLADFMYPQVLDYLIDQRHAGAPKDLVLPGLFPVLAQSQQPSKPPARVPAKLQRMRDKLQRLIDRARGKRRVKHRTIERPTPCGQPRRYVVYPGFLEAVGAIGTPGAVADALIEVLDDYG